MQNDILRTKPTGGFPQIFVCRKRTAKRDKVRGFTQDEKKTVASIKDIMEERKKDVRPFIELSL